MAQVLDSGGIAGASYVVPSGERSKQLSVAAELYRWLAEDWGAQGVPRWNFHKILFDRAGRPLDAWPSRVRPESAELRQAIEAQLPG